MPRNIKYYHAGSLVERGRSSSGPPPPPPPQAQWAGQVVNRCLFGTRARETPACNLQWSDQQTIFAAHSPAMANKIFLSRVYADAWMTETTGGRPIANDVATRLNTAISEGVMVCLSFKVPGTDWAGVAAGSYDADLQTFHDFAVARNATHPTEVYVISVHHEPANTAGHTMAEWASMQLHLTNFFADISSFCVYAPIVNGFWFGQQKASHTQEVLDALPPALVTAINNNNGLIMADCYDSADPVNDPPTKDHTHKKIQGWCDWARANGVKAIGMGEWGCGLGSEIDACWAVIKANTDIMSWATYFNSGGNSRADWRLIPNGYPPDPTFSVGTDPGGTAISQAKLDSYATAAIAAQYAYIGGVQQ